MCIVMFFISELRVLVFLKHEYSYVEKYQLLDPLNRVSHKYIVDVPGLRFLVVMKNGFYRYTIFQLLASMKLFYVLTL